MTSRAVKPCHQWFNQARFGLFIHWGLYSLLGRGEQVLIRERLDPAEYARLTARFTARRFDPDAWARCAKNAGMKYAVLTTKHHDGFCLFDSALTDYTAVKAAAGRDLVADYVKAFRKQGLKVGLYYSLADLRFPAYYKGPQRAPAAFAEYIRFLHAQVRELCTNYGRIDLLWFDGEMPHNSEAWQASKLVRMVRRLQPHILINNRLGAHERAGWGDFGTPEHTIAAESGRLWESCQVSTWRLWGYAAGERWRPAGLLLDMLCEAAAKGGNLLLNVGPKADGTFPAPFVKRMERIGAWMKRHGEAIYGSEPAACDFVTHGRQTVKGNTLYLLIRFWPGPEVHLAGLKTRVLRAKLLSTGQRLHIEQHGDHVYLRGLPRKAPDPLCTVIALACKGKPKPCDWAQHGVWEGDPTGRLAEWLEG
ncbi:MAG: alpha-L-fucosidase [Candidatus Hydrogenedentes bacterium]|nr:alpha-L-fucosidase [Candidatus Hydrogenedentota bacterium]